MKKDLSREARLYRAIYRLTKYSETDKDSLEMMTNTLRTGLSIILALYENEFVFEKDYEVWQREVRAGK